MRTREISLYFIVISFIFGIILEEALDSLWAIFVALLCISILLMFLLCFSHKKRILTLLLIAGFSICAGAGRIWIFDIRNNKAIFLDKYIGQRIEFEGILTEEPEEREFGTLLYVRPTRFGNEKVKEKLKILVSTKSPKEFYYGDVLKVKGELRLPENFYTDSGREFDYVGYLKSRSIKFVVRNSSVNITNHDPPSKILAQLFAIKRKFIESLDRSLPEPHSSLASGIIIDGKGSINKDLQEQFRKVGIIHIVVLSGYNVSIVAEAIGKIFAFLPRSLGLFSSCIGIILFAFVTGGSATVIRASIMAILVLLSKFSIRKYDPLRALFIASLIMLAHNPSILLHNPSFQLSFMATFAVVAIVPKIESKIKFFPEKLGIRGLVFSTITVQLFLLPLILWMNGSLSIVALPVNLLIVPLIPFTMLVSFISGIIGLIWHILAIPFSFISYLLLQYELTIVKWFSSLAFGEISPGSFSVWMLGSVYVLYGVIFYFFASNEKRL